VGGDQLLLPNVVRAIGQALVMTPITVLAAAGIEDENAASASALVNVIRNLGGAVGIAALQTFLVRREQFHMQMLGQSVSMFDENTRRHLDELAQYFLSQGVSDPGLALQKALVAIGQRVRLEAYTMAFGDIFFVLGGVLLAALLSVLLLKKPGAFSIGGNH